MRHVWRSCVIAASVISLAACADMQWEGSDQSSANADSGTKALGSAIASSTIPDIAEIMHPSAASEYVGALDDVTAHTCERIGDGWRVTAEITNPTPATADYRVYVSLVNGAIATRALVEVEVLVVDPGAVGGFDTLIAMPEDDLRCVLRVERH